MSLTRLTLLLPPPQVVELRERGPGSPPPPAPDSQPPMSQRLRVGEPGGALGAAAWRLPVVPRLSEAEKAWALPPRPFRAPLLAPGGVFPGPSGVRAEEAASEERMKNLRCPQRGVELDTPLPPPPSPPSSHCGPGASRRFSAAGWGDRGGVAGASRRFSAAGRGDLLPLQDLHLRGRESEDGHGHSHSVPARGQGRGEEDEGAGTLTGNGRPETQPAWRPAAEGRPEADRKGGRSVPASVPPTPAAPNPPQGQGHPLFLFLDGGAGAGRVPGVPEGRPPPVRSRSRAGEKRGRQETGVPGYTDGGRTPERRAAKRWRKLREEAHVVGAEVAKWGKLPEEAHVVGAEVAKWGKLPEEAHVVGAEVAKWGKLPEEAHVVGTEVAKRGKFPEEAHVVGAEVAKRRKLPEEAHVVGAEVAKWRKLPEEDAHVVGAEVAKRRKLLEEAHILGAEVAKRRKLPQEAHVLGAEGTCSEGCGQNDVSSQSVCVVSAQRCSRSGTQSGVRGPQRSFRVALPPAPGKAAETGVHGSLPSRLLGKRQRENYDVRPVWRESGETSWGRRRHDAAEWEARRDPGGKWDLVQLPDAALLSKEGCDNIKAIGTTEEQPKLRMIGTRGSQKALVSLFWFSGEGESNKMLQLPLQYCTSHKDFYLSNIFVNFIAERFHFHASISAKGADNNSILAWHEILKCLKQTDAPNLIIRNRNVHRRNNIYLQSDVSKPLYIILKTNIVSLLNNFDSLTGTENDSTLGEGCISKWAMCLSYPKKSMVENYTVSLGRTFSIPVGGNMKPMLEKKKLFKTELVFEEFEKQPIHSFSMTTENELVFEEFEKQPIPSFSMTTENVVLMDLDDRDGISYQRKTCPEQVMKVKNWAQRSTSAVKMQVNSPPQFIQNNYEYIHENFYEINMHSGHLDTEGKQEHKEISSFNCKCIVEGTFNVRQQAIPASRNTKRTEQTNPTILAQVPNVGSLLKSDIEAKQHDLILKEEENVLAQSLTSYQPVQKDSKMEKEEENRFYAMDGIFSVQPVSLMSRKENGEETKHVNQHNLADKKEYESVLQESELANLKHFYPKNDSTECAKHQFEGDLSVGNNECFQDLTAKCLPTEVMTIAKDFEMKSKFDLVLEQLHTFHKISKENETLSTLGANNGRENYFRENDAVEAVNTEIKKDLEIGAVNKVCASSLACDAEEGPNIRKRHQSLFNWETVPRNREQEVPNENSCLPTSEEEVLYPTSEEDCEKPLPQRRPAFSSDEFIEEKMNYMVKGGSNFSHGISRVLPLKTCSRPIRVGLSRKAKLKQLHPYLK